MRRRLYLMRHAEVAYFDADGRPFPPDHVALTPAGEEQARSAADALSGIAFDRVVTSGLSRTLDTARIVARGVEPESWPDLRELRPGVLDGIPDDEVERAFTGVFNGVVPRETPFLAGETIGELVDRVVPAVDRLAADRTWDTTLAVLHGGVNRAILSYALTGEPRFLGRFEQAPACINVLDVGDDGWIVRAVNVTPYDVLHGRSRSTTMEELYAQYRRGADG
jgi:broad specificity phosphatase PhoE